MQGTAGRMGKDPHQAPLTRLLNLSKGPSASAGCPIVIFRIDTVLLMLQARSEKWIERSKPPSCTCPIDVDVGLSP